MKVDGSNLRTDVFQEEWCVGKREKGQFQLMEIN